LRAIDAIAGELCLHEHRQQTRRPEPVAAEQPQPLPRDRCRQVGISACEVKPRERGDRLDPIVVALEQRFGSIEPSLMHEEVRERGGAGDTVAPAVVCGEPRAHAQRHLGLGPAAHLAQHGAVCDPAMREEE
jgi:hypothetical protein